MMRLAESLVFLSLATGLHVGLWAVAPAPDGALSSGQAGLAPFAQVATPGQARLVEAWTRPPQAETVMQAALPRPAAPPDAASRMPAPVLPQAMPSLAVLPPVLPPALAEGAPPRVDPAPPGPRTPPATALVRPQTPEPPSALAPAVTPRPETRPEPPVPQQAEAPKADRAPAPPQAPAQPAARAAGPKAAEAPKASGARGQDAAQSANAAQSRALQADWGARIQRKVHRSLRYPSGAGGEGTARVALTVDPSGRLTGLQLIRSSGVSAFDQEALRAVRTAGRFPAAPDGLTEASYSFTLALTFRP